jgi:hypothetical protein
LKEEERRGGKREYKRREAEAKAEDGEKTSPVI